MELKLRALRVTLPLGALVVLAYCSTPVLARSSDSMRSLTVYVSVSDSGAGNGSQASPFHSLFRAQRTVRAMLRSGAASITVEFETGTYRLSRPLGFGPADTDFGAASVIWRAAPGAKPIVSGAEQIQGWHLTNPSAHIWSARVPDTLRSRQLYVNGQRAYIDSGLPPTSLTRTATGFEAATNAFLDWPELNHVDFVFQQQLGVMAQAICPIGSIHGLAISMAQPCWDNSTLRQNTFDSLSPIDDNLVGRGTLTTPSYIENALPLLRRPGQFYLDQNHHRLYYIPRRGQDMRSADVEVPVLQNLVSGIGLDGSPLENLSFQGIEFAYTTWLQPGSRQGFSEIQAGYTLTGRDAYQTQGLCSLVPEGVCPYGAWTPEPAAVAFMNDRNVSLAGDEFVHLGSAGVSLGDGSQFATVEGSVFTDISGNGLELGGVDQPNADSVQQTLDDTVENNLVYDIGAEYPGAVGILVGYAANCTISHNQLDDLPYTGISVGWGGWLDKIGQAPVENYSQGNVIDDNLIFDYMLTFADGGGIYFQGSQGTSLTDGAQVSGNVVYGQFDWSYELKTDDAAGYITFSGNVAYGSGYAYGIVHHDATQGPGQNGQPPYYPLDYADNYWDQTAASFNAGRVTVENSHLIDGADQAPESIVDNAGLDPPFQALLSWNAEARPLDQIQAAPVVAYSISRRAYVAWQPALGGPSQPVTEYIVRGCPAGTGNCAHPITKAVSVSRYQKDGYTTVSNLQPGVGYRFTVAAVDDYGAGTPSVPSRVVVAGSDQSQLSDPPTSIYVNQAPGEASVAWYPPQVCSENPWGGSFCRNPVLGYQVDLSDGTSVRISDPADLTVSNGGGRILRVFEDLQAGVSYSASVAAITPAGVGTPAEVSWIQKS